MARTLSFLTSALALLALPNSLSLEKLLSTHKAIVFLWRSFVDANWLFKATGISLVHTTRTRDQCIVQHHLQQRSVWTAPLTSGSFPICNPIHDRRQDRMTVGHDACRVGSTTAPVVSFSSEPTRLTGHLYEEISLTPLSQEWSQYTTTAQFRIAGGTFRRKTCGSQAASPARSHECASATTFRAATSKSDRARCNGQHEEFASPSATPFSYHR